MKTDKSRTSEISEEEYDINRESVDAYFSQIGCLLGMDLILKKNK